MAGQIIKCGTRRYQVRIFDGYDENGKRIYRNKQIRGTRKNAETYLAHALIAKDLGALVKQPSMTLGAYLDKWLEFVRTRVSRRTGDGYAALLERYIRKPLGRKRLDTLESMEIQTVYSKMLAPKPIGSGVGARVVRHTHAVLHNALEQAVAWKKITSNPCARPAVVLPKVKTEELTVLSQDDAATFLNVAATMSHGFLFEFALLTGMRPEEYLALQWPDIDFERATAMVQRVLIRYEKSWTFEEPKTPTSRRPVSLPATLVHKLAAHKRAQAEQRLRVGASWQAHDLVFCGRHGLPLSIPNITYRYFRPLLEKAKLPHMRLYDLRHSHATLLLIAGEHPKVVSERLGHASIRITMDTYSHVLPNMQERTATQLEKTFYSIEQNERHG